MKRGKKAFYKIPDPFRRKTLKLEIGRNFLTVIRGICEEPTADSILSGERLKTFSLKSGTSKTSHFHHSYETLYCKS